MREERFAAKHRSLRYNDCVHRHGSGPPRHVSLAGEQWYALRHCGRSDCGLQQVLAESAAARRRTPPAKSSEVVSHCTLSTPPSPINDQIVREFVAGNEAFLFDQLIK